jgi:hypothetical protein
MTTRKTLVTAASAFIESHNVTHYYTLTYPRRRSWEGRHKALSDSINRLRRGQLDPRVANAMGYLTSVLLRSLEQGPIEERLAKIEATLAANGPEGNGAKRI